MLQVKVGSFSDVQNLLSDLDEGLYKMVLEPALTDVSALGEFVAKSHVPVFMGNLKNNIRGEAPVHQRFRRRAVAILIADSDYAVYVEMGFRAHFVPFALAPSLYDWARIKLGWQPVTVARRGPERKYLKDKLGVEHWGMAVGQKARPFMEPARVAAQAELPRSVERQLEKFLAIR